MDKYVYEKIENRYRFSLAHEIGHMILHKDLYDHYKFNSIGEWIKVINEIPQDLKERAEFQAKEFAGLVLVPGNILKDKYQDAFKEAERIIHNFDENEMELIQGIAVNLLAKEFVVSWHVMEIRLRNDGLT